MKKIITKAILFLCIGVTSLKSESGKAFEQLESCNRIRYSSVLVKENNKSYQLPIFEGSYGEITYDELKKQAKDKKVYLLYNICLDLTGKTEHKKRVLDLIEFYSKTILKDNFRKDIYIPTLIADEHGLILVFYDFVYDGIPGYLKIDIMPYKPLNASATLPKNIKELNFGKAFSLVYEVNLGSESGWKK